MITSPCIGVCAYETGSGWCRGCGRTQKEIATWGSASPSDRARVWSEVPERLDRLGATVRRPDWTTEQMLAFVHDMLHSGTGAWSLGIRGAVAAMVLHDPAAALDGETITARAADGALRLGIDRSLQALEFIDEHGARRALALVVHSFRLPDAAAKGLHERGPDTGAIDPAHRDAMLFDLGLGTPSARFMVRTANPALIARLRASQGMTLGPLLAAVGDDLMLHCPTRVVETFGCRAEVYTPIPAPDGIAPALSHTRLIPGAVGLGSTTPTGLDLPPGYAPVAIWHPSAVSDA